VSERRRILLVGVGGQGVLSAGRWIGDAATDCGIPVVVGQIHGLSQRGGPVQAPVALGGARSWEIADGMADFLVAFEPMEAARALRKVSRRTTAIVNTRPIVPGSLQSAGRPYPPLPSLLVPVEEAAGAVVAIDATALAESAGSHRSLNVVMLGMLAGLDALSFPGERLLEVILNESIPGLAEINRTAFRLGAESMEARSVHEKP
jgi:indolepyruvate ferredoxin oxidoreductase beta subunit